MIREATHAACHLKAKSHPIQTGSRVCDDLGVHQQPSNDGADVGEYGGEGHFEMPRLRWDFDHDPRAHAERLGE